jgi:hypothetical protein
MDPVSVQPAANVFFAIVMSSVMAWVPYLIAVGFVLVAFDAAVNRVVRRARHGQLPPRYWR